MIVGSWWVTSCKQWTSSHLTFFLGPPDCQPSTHPAVPVPQSSCLLQSSFLQFLLQTLNSLCLLTSRVVGSFEGAGDVDVTGTPGHRWVGDSQNLPPGPFQATEEDLWNKALPSFQIQLDEQSTTRLLRLKQSTRFPPGQTQDLTPDTNEQKDPVCLQLAEAHGEPEKWSTRPRMSYGSVKT